MCLAAVQPETAALAAEALVSMICISKDTVTHGTEALACIITHWQAAWQGAQQAAAAVAAAAGSSGGGGGEAGGEGGGAGGGMEREVLQAGCSVLCAAGAALLPPALAGNGGYHSQFLLVAQQLLQQLTSTDVDVSGRMLTLTRAHMHV